MTVRRATAIVALAIALGAAGFAVWLWRYRTRKPALEAGWAAVATVLAGTGEVGVRDGHASDARFSDPFGIAIGRDGSVYVADLHRIRRIAASGEVTTFAGTIRGYADGSADRARFDTLSALAVAADGTIYAADTGNN